MKRFYVEYKVDLGHGNFLGGKYFIKVYANHEHYDDPRMLNFELTSAYHVKEYVRLQHPNFMFSQEDVKVLKCVDAPLEVDFV